MPKVTRLEPSSEQYQVDRFVKWFNDHNDNPSTLNLDHRGGRSLHKKNRLIFRSDPRSSWLGYMEVSDKIIKLFLHRNYFEDNVGSLYQLAMMYEDRHSDYLSVEIVELL